MTESTPPSNKYGSIGGIAPLWGRGFPSLLVFFVVTDLIVVLFPLKKFSEMLPIGISAERTAPWILRGMVVLAMLAVWTAGWAIFAPRSRSFKQRLLTLLRWGGSVCYFITACIGVEAVLRAPELIVVGLVCILAVCQRKSFEELVAGEATKGISSPL